MAADAHKIFITEEDRKQNRRKELEVRALSLWASYAEEYKTLPFDYFFCLQEKRKRKLRLHRLPVAIEDYPNLPLLRYVNRYDAEKFVNKLTFDELSYIVETTEDAVEHDYAIRSLREWLRDAKYIIRRHDEQQKSSSNIPPTTADTIASPWG